LLTAVIHPAERSVAPLVIIRRSSLHRDLLDAGRLGVSSATSVNHRIPAYDALLPDAICYPEPSLPECWRTCCHESMYVLVRGYRAILLENSMPNLMQLGILTLGSVALAIAGHACFTACGKLCGRDLENTRERGLVQLSRNK